MEARGMGVEYRVDEETYRNITNFARFCSFYIAPVLVRFGSIRGENMSGMQRDPFRREVKKFFD
jgi:hypothetical protein